MNSLHPGRGSISLCPSEFGKVPGEEFGAVVPGAAGLALALCHLVALTILTIAAPALVLRHVVLMEVSNKADLWGAGRLIERTWVVWKGGALVAT